MQRYFIYLSYDGTAYHGWQIQPNGISVQECLNSMLGYALKQKVFVVGAGRTDAGVHARLMVAHFDTEIEVGNLNVLTEKLNRMLPPDISIQQIVKVRNDAHARFSPVSRTYKYYLSLKKDPFNRAYQWNICNDLDFNKMNEAAALLLKCSDFTSFSKSHSDSKTNICKVECAQWENVGNDKWVFTIKADRFLRNMVRAVVGTLVDVGLGKLKVDDFKRVIEQKDRCKAGASVPAKGLFLENIIYPSDITDIE